MRGTKGQEKGRTEKEKQKRRRRREGGGEEKKVGRSPFSVPDGPPRCFSARILSRPPSFKAAPGLPRSVPTRFLELLASPNFEVEDASPSASSWVTRRWRRCL